MRFRLTYHRSYGTERLLRLSAARLDPPWVAARRLAPPGRPLGLVVVAEGVEREEDVTILRSMGCQLGQGFHLGRPMPEDAARMLLMRNPQNLHHAFEAAA